MLERERRHQKIVSLIAAKPVATQGELSRLLERAGFAVTQSSVSRDIAELGIVKRRGRYVVPQAGNGAKSRGLVSLVTAGSSLVVAKCEPGHASAVAVEIDGASLAEVVGTLAGEDTVFVAVEDAKAQRAAMKKIWGLFS
ncbi:MAG: arginine repressor [Acidobacteria bacterium]|nr:arginine repressor [Acidobacteriota bacterium]